MANGTFNIAKGRSAAYADNVNNNTPATSGLILVLLKVAEADATLEDYDNLSLLLAGANTEADFTDGVTPYARKTLTDTDSITVTTDDSANTVSIDFPDQVWTSAGGTTDNTLVKMIMCYAPDVAGADSTLIPLTHHDFAITTNGNDLTATINANGIFVAS